MFTDLLIAMFDSGLTSLGTETIDASEAKLVCVGALPDCATG